MREFKTFTPEHLLPLVMTVFPKLVDQERCLILYDKINWFSSLDKNKDTKGANISKLYMRSILGGTDKTNKIVNALKRLNIIGSQVRTEIDENGVAICKESYQPGNFAKCYFIKPEFVLNNKNLRCRKVTEKKNIDALERAKQRTLFNKKLKHKKYKHILDNFEKIGIDAEAAERFIQTEFKDISNSKYFKIILPVQKISEGMVDFIRGNNGRLITTFTNLKRELRKFLFDKTDGSFDFVEIDISNCQPLLATIYFEQHYPEYTDRKDFQGWKELCQTGQLYESLTEGTDFDRQFIKDRFMDVLLFTAKNKTYLLEDKNWNNENQLKKKFIEHFVSKFPTIWELLLLVKEKIGNREFAKRIQKMESDLMIDSVLVDLYNCQTNFSIHDSIVCRSSDKDFVKEKIKAVFLEKQNYLINLKEKNLYS